ncbi:MAG: hypothetical protein ACXQTS_04595, partial [Candidatus Methanospirareceae archaeon]
MTFKEIEESSEKIKEVEERNQELPTLKELLFDTFNSFFKYNPTFRNDNEIREDYLINKEVLSKAMRTEQYKKLRAITQLDEVNS